MEVQDTLLGMLMLLSDLELVTVNDRVATQNHRCIDGCQQYDAESLQMRSHSLGVLKIFLHAQTVSRFPKTLGQVTNWAFRLDFPVPHTAHEDDGNMKRRE